jgi:hypothetical protein
MIRQAAADPARPIARPFLHHRIQKFCSHRMHSAATSTGLTTLARKIYRTPPTGLHPDFDRPLSGYPSHMHIHGYTQRVHDRTLDTMAFP